MAKAYLSMGSNMEPEQHLGRALAELRERFGEVHMSPTYRTTAIGFDGPDFLNLAAIIDSDLDVYALNDWLHQLEQAHGRRRDQLRFSSRPLDIDIVFFDDLVLKGPGHLELPRPDIEHAFVLQPLADIAPDFVHPLTGLSLAQMWREHPKYVTGAE